MSKTVKIILITLIILIVIAITIFSLIRWVILPGMIYKQGLDVISSDEMKKTEINAFNSRFDAYKGIKKGSTVKQIIQTVLNTNSSSDKTVNINFNGKTYLSQDISDIYNLIIKTKTYNVTLQYDNEGYVETVLINENN